MLIKEIEPIGSFGKSVLEEENSDELIDKMVEFPLRQPCKTFKEKGIETVMSSANKNNVLSEGQKRIEKQDAIGGDFEYAGKGYAWIMLNFDSLSSKNKKLLFKLEKKKDKFGKPIGEKAIWFMRSTPLDYLFASQGKYQKQKSHENRKEKVLSKEFNKRCIFLSYNSDYYPKRVIMIRMPINEQSTVEEVEDFFTNFARSFHSQEKQNKKEKVWEIEEK